MGDKMMMMFMLFTLMQSCIATRKSAMKLALAEKNNSTRNPRTLKLERKSGILERPTVTYFGTPAKPQLVRNQCVVERPTVTYHGAPATQPQLYDRNANTGTPRSTESSESSTSSFSYSDTYDQYAEKTDFSMEDTDDEPQTESEEKTQGVYTKGELRPRATMYKKAELSPMEKCQQVQDAYNQCYKNKPTRDQFLKFAQKNEKSPFKLNFREVSAHFTKLQW